MASSLTSPSLVFAAERAIVAAHASIAKAKVFATDFSAEAAQPGSTLKVPVFTPSTASNFDPTSNNYATTDGSVTYASVTFSNHPKHTFSFSDTDFNLVNGRQFWDRAGEASGIAVGKAIITAVSALFGSVAQTASLTVTKAGIAGLRSTATTNGFDPGRSVLMLDSANFATLLSLLDYYTYGDREAIKDGVVPGLYGFKAVMENNYLPAGTKGALVAEDALVVAGRTIAVQSPRVYQEVGYTTDEDSGLTLGLRRGADWATGMNYATVEALFGAALVQPSKAVKLT
jgi:hypothetical protein